MKSIDFERLAAITFMLKKNVLNDQYKLEFAINFESLCAF